MAVIDSVTSTVTHGLHATVEKLIKLGYNLADT